MDKRRTIDEFTDLPLSKQRKSQLRNPEHYKRYARENRKKLEKRVYMREYGRRYLDYKKRHFGAKSYKDEALEALKKKHKIIEGQKITKDRSYCQNVNCPNKGIGFLTRKMIKKDGFVFCSDDCTKEIR